MNEYEYEQNVYEPAGADDGHHQNENDYAHNRLRKLRKGKADEYRYLEESTDTASPHPSFYVNEDETINREW